MDDESKKPMADFDEDLPFPGWKPTVSVTWGGVLDRSERDPFTPEETEIANRIGLPPK